MAGDHRLKPVKIDMARDPHYSGQVYFNANACDIAAPANRNNTPSPGTYQLVRSVNIPQSDQQLFESYGPVVLYYAKRSGATLAIHGGNAPEPDRLFNPDFGLAMHNGDLQRLANAVLRGEATQTLEVSLVDLGWWKRQFRTTTVQRHVGRMGPFDLHIPLQQMRLVRRPQHGDDVLEGDRNFWIAVHRDHQVELRANPEKDSPFIPGGGVERGAGASGSFDESEQRPTTVRDLFDSGKVGVGSDGRLAAGTKPIVTSFSIGTTLAAQLRAEDELADKMRAASKAVPADHVLGDSSASADIDNGARILAGAEAEVAPDPTENADKSGNVEASETATATVEVADNKPDDAQQESSNNDSGRGDSGSGGGDPPATGGGD